MHFYLVLLVLVGNRKEPITKDISISIGYNRASFRKYVALGYGVTEMNWSNYQTKSTALGAVLIVAGVVKSINPEWVTFFTVSADVLVMAGLGIIFGRDAIRKMIP
jgi:hypothetical protein